jgi:hypothetical protein
MTTITRCGVCYRAFRQPDPAEPIYGRDGRPLAGAAYYAAFQRRVRSTTRRARSTSARRTRVMVLQVHRMGNAARKLFGLPHGRP